MPVCRPAPGDTMATMSEPGWKEKVVVVTGGSAGLGKSIALAFGQRGATVVIAARGQEQLAAAAQELQSAGCNVRAIAADAGSESDVKRLIDEVQESYGRLDALVNNTGRSTRMRVLDTSPAEFRDMMEANFLSAVICTRAAAPLLRAGRGHIVNIGSLAAKIAPRYMGAYPATKFAMAAYSQQLRLELAAEGVHVLLVCPGPIQRPTLRTYTTPDSDLPPEVQKAGAGAKLSGIPPDVLARKIVRACERRQPELIVPKKAWLLFVLQQVSPRLGDWLLTKFTS